MLKNPNLRIVDTVFDPDSTDKIIRYKRRGNSVLYKVWLYLDGGDVPFVHQVTYRLHKSFPNPERVIYRTPANPKCQLIIWTWGLFTIQATVTDKKGFFYTLEHPMEYDRQLSSVPPENYVEES